MHPRRRPSGGLPRAAALAVAVAVATLVSMAAAGPAMASARHSHPPARPSGHAHSSSKAHSSGPSHPASKPHPASQRPPSHQGWVKYYIVQPPANGHEEFLYEIAAKTLGSGKLAAQIFALNKGRLEPGGRHMETPTVIMPGWVLVLPSTASGPGVRYGPLPNVATLPSPAAPSSPSARRPALAAPRPHAVSGSRGLILAAKIAGVILLLLISGAALLMLIRLRSPAADEPDRPARPGGAAGVQRPGRRGRLSRRSDAGRPASPPQGIVLASGLAAEGEEPVLPGPAFPAAIGEGVASGESADQSAVSVTEPGGPAGQPAVPGYPSWLGEPPTEPAGEGGQPVAPGYPSWLGEPPTGPGEFTDPAGPVTPGWAALPHSGSGPDRPAMSPAPVAIVAPALTPAVTDAPPAVAPPAVSAPAGPLLPGDDGELPWPAFLAPAGPGSDAAVRAGTGGPSSGSPVTGAGDEAPAPRSGPLSATAGAPDEEAFSPVALRILGAQRSSARRAESADVPAQRHRVALGDDRIDVVLTEAPVVSHEGRPRSGHTWLTATPYLVWTPLPYDAPDDGVAFACIGAGDEGCLFIDLAAAPGAIAIGGDSGAPVRLAESIARQLCMASAGGQLRVVVVGSALPTPCPPGAAWVARVRDLASAATAGPEDGTEIVFCELRSNEDAFALARYVASAQRRVVPVVLANLPDAPWSFTAQPSRRPAEAPQPAIA
jgi:hypothetical protein